MNECAWCGDTDVALHGDGEWRICKGCTIACSWLGTYPEPAPMRELEHMRAHYSEMRSRNEARRPAGLPALPPEADDLLTAIAEQRAKREQLAPYRDVLIARNVCYCCAARIDTSTFGASGPNVNICRACLAAARVTHGLG